MAALKHGDKFPVEFNGSIPRTDVSVPGVTRNYFRNNFVVDGKEFSVSSPNDLAGLTGTVMFVQKGKEKPGGGTVTADAWTLTNLTTITALKNKLERKTLEAQVALIP